MCGRGKLSLGQAMFKSVKSIRTLYFPFFFLKTTGLASESGYLTSLIDPTLTSQSNLSFTARARSGPSLRHLYLITLKVGSAFSSWEVTLMSIHFIYEVDPANVLVYDDRV